MKFIRIVAIAPCAALIAAAAFAGGAVGQQATPLPPAAVPAPAAAAPTAPVDTPPAPSVIKDPSIAAATPALPADERLACKHVVIVEDIPYKWDALEKGTETAWTAYMNGEFPKSVPVFAKLAGIGHPVAEWLMGNVYFFGQGVPLDYRTSLMWFEKAADQGCFAAFAPTAQMYERGDGTAIDLGKAYMWYNIAIAQLPQGKQRREMGELRDKVAAQMTPAQIAAAQKRSLQFKRNPVVPPDISELPEDFFKQP
jgi:TPR repeat protein